MFYSSQILARKGPLGVVWMAAHLDGQLKRSQVFDMSIPGTVEVLLSPDAPLALRLTGQLLLGVVRIFARKVNYLHQDCNEALTKIRVAFRISNLELAPENAVAQAAAITLPDNALDDFALFVGPGDPGASQGMEWQFGGPSYSTGAGAAAGFDGQGLSDMIDVEFDVLGLSSQGDVLLRQASMTANARRRSSVPGRLAEVDAQRSGGLGMLRRNSLAPLPKSQPLQGGGLLDEDEMFEDIEGDFLHDLGDIEVEQLRAASVQGPMAGDILAGLRGHASGPSGKAIGPSAGTGDTPQGQPSGGVGRAAQRGRASELGSLGSPEELGDKPMGLRTVAARRLPLAGSPEGGNSATPGRSSAGEVGLELEFEDWAPGSTTHNQQRPAQGRPASGSQALSLGGTQIEALLPMDLDEGVAAAASGGDATAGAHIPRTSPLVSCHAGETAEGMDVDGVEGQAAALALQTEPAAVDGGGAEVGLAAHADAQLQVQQQLGPGPMRTRLRSAAATPAAAATVAALTPMTLAPAAAAKGGAAVKPAAAVDIAARRGRAGLKSNIARHAPQVDARGNAGTLMTMSKMRALLNDRAPLLGNRRERWQRQQQRRHLQHLADAAAGPVLHRGFMSAVIDSEAPHPGPAPSHAVPARPLALLVQAATGRVLPAGAVEEAAGSFLAIGADMEAFAEAIAPFSPAPRMTPGVGRQGGAAGAASPAPVGWEATGSRRSGRLAGAPAPAVALAQAAQQGDDNCAVTGAGAEAAVPFSALNGARQADGAPSGRVSLAVTPGTGLGTDGAPWADVGMPDTGSVLPMAAPPSGGEGRDVEGQGPRLGSGLGSIEGSTSLLNRATQGGGTQLDVVFATQGTMLGQASGLAGCGSGLASVGVAEQGSRACSGQGRSLGVDESGKENQPPVASHSGALVRAKSMVCAAGENSQGGALAPLGDRTNDLGSPVLSQLGGNGESSLRKRQRLDALGTAAPGSAACAAAGARAMEVGRSPLGRRSTNVPAAQLGDVPPRSGATPGLNLGLGSQQVEHASVDDELMHSAPMHLDWEPASQEQQGSGARQGCAVQLGAAAAQQGTPGSAQRRGSQRAAGGQALAATPSRAGALMPPPEGTPTAGVLLGLSPAASDMGLGLASAYKGAPRRSSVYPGDGSGSGLLLASGSGSADDGPQGNSQVAALTKAAGSVLDRVACAALAKLPESVCSTALSQAETGLLTQEAATQLTQARLSMQQLTQGSSRLQACRWFSELLLLKTRGLVQLQQGGAYDDVEVGLTQPGVAATASQLLTTMLTQSQQ